MDNLFLLVFLLSLLSLSVFRLLHETKRQMNYDEIASFTLQWSFSLRFSALFADALTFSCAFRFWGIGVLSKVNECCCSWAQNKSRLRQMLIDATSRRVGEHFRKKLLLDDTLQALSAITCSTGRKVANSLLVIFGVSQVWDFLSTSFVLALNPNRSLDRYCAILKSVTRCV